MVHISRGTLAIGAQSVLNVILALSLYNEYLHNRFMQDYLATAFSSVNPVLPVGLLTAVAVAGSSFTVYSRRHQGMSLGVSSKLKTELLAEPADNRATVDTCPFCDTPLKSISENRFQCRKCRKYYKKEQLKLFRAPV